MKKYMNSTFRNLLYVAALMLVIASCKKSEDVPTDPARIFKPGDLSVSASATTARLKWVQPILSTGKTFKYTVDFTSIQFSRQITAVIAWPQSFNIPE